MHSQQTRRKRLAVHTGYGNETFCREKFLQKVFFCCSEDPRAIRYGGKKRRSVKFHGIHWQGKRKTCAYYFQGGVFMDFLWSGLLSITWQQVIKKFSLSTAYANKSVYLLWSQIWAVLIFHENLSIQNIIGILVVLFGVWTVQRYE